MSALAFAASIVRSLAWPAAVVIIACLFFREQIREVIRKIAERIPHLRSVKAGGTEWTFDSDQLAGARTDLAKIYAAGSVGSFRLNTGSLYTDDTSSLNLGRILRDHSAGITGSARAAGEAANLRSRYRPQAMAVRSLADDAPPTVTVLSAWAFLESLLKELARLLGVTDTGSLALLADEVITRLDRRGGLPAPDHARSVVQRLQRLRLPVERGAAVTRLEAMDYAETALQITDLLLTAYEPAFDATLWTAEPEQPEQPGGGAADTAASPGE